MHKPIANLDEPAFETLDYTVHQRHALAQFRGMGSPVVTLELAASWCEGLNSSHCGAGASCERRKPGQCWHPGQAR